MTVKIPELDVVSPIVATSAASRQWTHFEF
jgi:hypothetical protein